MAIVGYRSVRVRRKYKHDSLDKNINMKDRFFAYVHQSEEVGHGPKRLMEVKIDQSETRNLR